MSDGTDVFFMDDDNFLSSEDIMNQIEDDKPTQENQERRVQVEPKEQQAYPLPNSSNNQNEDFKADIYKKWFRTKNKQGFLALREWFEAGKVSFDIGEIVDGKTTNTVAWAEAIEVAAFLRAVANGTGALSYPQRGKLPEESLEVYGGFYDKSRNNQPVSRVLKITYWKAGDNLDSTAFAFKCGHFKASVPSSGAFIPDMKAMLSANQIKVTRAEVAQMSYRLDLALQNYAAKYNGDLFKALNGESK